jgi:hypothetical protein
MTCWVKVVVDRNAFSGILGWDNTVGDTTHYLWTNSDGTTIRRECDSAATTLINVTVGNWYFIGCTYFAAATDFGYYTASVGSVTTEVTTSTAGGVVADSHTLRIGTTRTTNWLNGSVAAVKIWTAGLTKTEIDAERSTYSPVRTSNLWANYTFRNGPQTTDDSGNSRTLTAAGTLTTDTSGPPIT